MSPQLIASYRHESSGHPAPLPLSVEDARGMLTRVGTVMTYHGRDVLVGGRGQGSSDDDESVRSDDGWTEDAELDDAPPSTQPRPLEWRLPSLPPRNASDGGSASSMEQYICFVYRDFAVSSLGCFRILY